MNRISRLFHVLLAAAAVSALGACASSPTETKQNTAQTARDISSDIQATESQIDATLSSLKTLVATSQNPSQAAFDRYSGDVDKMRTQAKTVNQGVVDMRKDGQAYLANWATEHDEIQNEELRQASEQRRRAMMDSMQNIDESYNRVGTPLDAFIRNLEDVRTALSNDFTEHGIATVLNTDVVEDAETNAANAKISLEEMRSDSAALADALPVEPGIQSSATQ